MADLGVVRDGNRLPWLEPYRAPPRKKSNRRAGAAAAIGAAGLAGVVTLLMRDAPMLPAEEPAPQASVVLPAPADMQPPIVLPPLERHEQATERPVARTAAKPPRRARVAARRKIKAVPTSAAYRTVMKNQAAKPATEVMPSEIAIAIAALPAPVPTPLVRPAVNPQAQVVRGKTVQLGVYTTIRQAEFAWQSAVRDYTYLATMPKSIEAISIRSKRFYRLQLGTPSRQHAKQLCTNLKTIGRACTVA